MADAVPPSALVQAAPAGAYSSPMETKALCLILASQAEHSPKALPLGAACVASAIKADAALSSRIDARVESAEPGEAAAEFARRIAAMGPAYVGCSLFAWNRGFLAEAARELRALLPGAVLFAGGPEATAAPGSFVRSEPYDFILPGEGEASVPRLLSALPPSGDPRPAALPFILEAGVADPELLPSPWLDGSIAALERGGALWELTRGCPFACAYCYESKGSMRARPLPMARLEAELELFARAGIEQVSVLDPTFNADRERTRALLDLIEEKGEGMFFSFEVRAEFLDRDQARRFASIPCSVQVGLQSAKSEVMKALGRPFDPGLFARKLRMLDEAGAVYGIDLMYGLPGDSHRGFLDSLAFALELRPNHLDVFRLAILPGTLLSETAAASGVEWDREPPYLVKGSPGYPPQDVERSASFARAVEVFYNKGRAVPWFGALATAAGLSYGALAAEVETALRLRAEAKGLGEADADGVYDHTRIEEFQLDFAASLLLHRGRPECVDAVRDLIRLHGAYSRALAECEETVLSLSYDPEAVLSQASQDPRAFARSAKRRPSRVWIGRDEEGEVDLRPLPPEQGQIAKREAGAKREPDPKREPDGKRDAVTNRQAVAKRKAQAKRKGSPTLDARADEARLKARGSRDAPRKGPDRPR